MPTAQTKRPRIALDLSDGRKLSFQGGDNDTDDALVKGIDALRASLPPLPQPIAPMTPQAKPPEIVAPGASQGFTRPVAQTPQTGAVATNTVPLLAQQGYSKDAAGNVTYGGQSLPGFSPNAPAAPAAPQPQTPGQRETAGLSYGGPVNYGWSAPPAPGPSKLEVETAKLARDHSIYRKALSGDTDAIAELVVAGKLDKATTDMIVEGIRARKSEAIAAGGRASAEKIAGMRTASSEKQTESRVGTMMKIAGLERETAVARMQQDWKKHEQLLKMRQAELDELKRKNISDDATKRWIAGEDAKIAKDREQGLNERAKKAEETRLADIRSRPHGKKNLPSVDTNNLTAADVLAAARTKEAAAPAPAPTGPITPQYRSPTISGEDIQIGYAGQAPAPAPAPAATAANTPTSITGVGAAGGQTLAGLAAQPPATVKAMTPDIAKQYLTRAGGNRQQAEALARQEGYSW